MRHRRSRRSSKGFSIIELMIVVLIIMIVASLVMPQLLIAIHKAKQKKTMAELHQVGTAWMSWLTDQAGASSAGSGKSYDISDFFVVDYVEIFDYLRPSSSFFYMQEVPQFDAWGAEMSYMRNANLRGDQVLLICAAARDKIFDTCNGQTTLPIGPFTRTDFDTDIVWADGTLIRWPATN